METKVETVIFVDVDGVLNVGIRDDEGPLLLNERDLRRVKKLRSSGKVFGENVQRTIERILLAAARLQPCGESYAAVACKGQAQLAGVFVQRLARLIKAAGDHTMVVLSSKWQEHTEKVRYLESALGEHLPNFAFHAKTGLELVINPESRLLSVARYLETLGLRESKSQLKVLVLEDFHISSLGFCCQGEAMDGAEKVEAFLRKKVKAQDCEVKLLHTFECWEENGPGLG
ncbi:unnamed protein product, partial [Effrenium voratum]